MAYAQDMGRSSIMCISFLLSFDYGIRVGAYTSLAIMEIRAQMCRLYSGWYQENFKQISTLTNMIIPLVFLVITLPMAIRTKVNHLKFYARVLFFFSCIILALVLLTMAVHSEAK